MGPILFKVPSSSSILGIGKVKGEMPGALLLLNKLRKFGSGPGLCVCMDVCVAGYTGVWGCIEGVWVWM